MPITLKRQMHHPATANTVFPLLCPVREAEWIPAWSAEIIRSSSGVSELGAIFKTPDGRIWVVAEYQPPQRISFVVTLPQLWFCAIKIVLTPEEAETCIADIEYTWYPLNPEGEVSINRWKESSEQHLGDWEAMLNRKLASIV